MSALTNIIRKELKELLTPATILPIVILTLVFGSIGGTMGGLEEEIQQKPVIGLINEQNTTYSSLATSILHQHAQLVYNGTSITKREEGIQTVQERNGAALLIIPSNFTNNIEQNKPAIIEVEWIVEGTGIMDTIPSSSVEGLISLIRQQISQQLITHANQSANASLVLNPLTKQETTNLKGHTYENISPGEITGLLSTQSSTTPIVIMMIIIIAGGMVISSMALEKENKTLETLLTLPVRRVSIVTGKIIASAAVGLLLAVIYMFGIGYYMQSFQFDMPSTGSTFSLALTTSDLILVGISLFITLVAGLSLCMLLGTMAKNYKSAQSLTAPVTMMAIFPMLLTMFTDFETLPLALKALVFAIPFSHPMMASKALLFDNYTLVFAGIAYVTVFAIGIIALVIWVFTTDRLITGSNIKTMLSKIRKRY
jgi:ABC-2 type transport system permease protein